VLDIVLNVTNYLWLAWKIGQKILTLQVSMIESLDCNLDFSYSSTSRS